MNLCQKVFNMKIPPAMGWSHQCGMPDVLSAPSKTPTGPRLSSSVALLEECKPQSIRQSAKQHLGIQVT
jgi:hypothetical protein